VPNARTDVPAVGVAERQTMAAATAEQQVAVGGRVALPPTYGPVETYLRYALAGATCATTAHTVLVPMDVVKTRLQVRAAAVCLVARGGGRALGP